MRGEGQGCLPLINVEPGNYYVDRQNDSQQCEMSFLRMANTGELWHKSQNKDPTPSWSCIGRSAVV